VENQNNYELALSHDDQSETTDLLKLTVTVTDSQENDETYNIPGYSNSRQREDLWIYALCSNSPASNTVTETDGCRKVRRNKFYEVALNHHSAGRG
jgi:hypothetical protein